MYKQVFIYVFLPIAAIPPHVPMAAQQTPVERHADSLLTLVRRADGDSLRFERLLELSYFWSDWDTAKAFAYLKDAENIYPNPSAFRSGQLLFHEAGIVYDSDILKAKDFYKRADRYFSQLESPRAFLYRSRLWNNYGTLVQKQDSADKYLRIIIEKSLPFARQSGSKEHISANLINIGVVLMNVTDYAKARRYYAEAIQVLSDLPGAHEDRLTAFVNAGKNEIYLRDFSRSRRWLDSAAMETKQIPHSAFIPEYYSVEGQYYRHLKARERAEQFYQKGVVYAQALNDPRSLTSLQFELYALYRDFKDFGAARKMLQAVSQSMKHPLDHNRLLILNERASLEYDMGNYRTAFDSLRVAFILLDSLHKREQGLKVLDLEKKYQTVEKENELLRLRAESLRQEQAINRNRWWVYGLLFAFAIMGVISWLIWRVSRQKKRLYEEELKALRHREQERQFRSILEGQEKERNRIARDLHDGLGGMLAGVKLKLTSILAQCPSVPTDMQDVVKQLDESSVELRRIARNMMPESLLSMGLTPALADLCKMMQTGKMKIKFQSIGKQDAYPRHLSISVYRIVQELLINAIKHSRASEILVQCLKSDQGVYITVEDDGIGFDQEKVGSEGLGLSNIRNRVSLLGGMVEIITRPDEGTVFNIEIPLTDEQADY
ncbi:MAG: hypothetical protein EAS52_15650 [Parapedobacter sp.]|nr:MAG: hypothetical protein EAS52_15650 [Parapedobacter sp.]